MFARLFLAMQYIYKGFKCKCIMQNEAVSQQEQQQETAVEEESSWEAGSSGSEFQTESETNSDEASGDEVSHYRGRKRAALS